MQPQRIGITALITLLTTATASFAPNFPVLLTTSPAVAQTPKLGKAKANLLYQRGFQQFNTERFLLAGSLRQEIKKPSADDLKQELDKLQQLLDTQRKNANPTIEADTLNKIGVIYVQLKEYTKALDVHQQALAIYQELGERTREAETLGYIGNAYFKAGKYQKVENLFRQKLESLRKVGDFKGEQLILKVMNRHIDEKWEFRPAYYATAVDRDIQERLIKGDISWQETLEISQLNLFIYREVGNRQGEALSLHTMGWAYRNLGHYYQALELYQQALKIARQIGKSFQTNVEAFFVAAIRERKGKDDSFFDPRLLKEAHKIVAQPRTILVYPFVLPEKTWLIWMSKGGVVKSIEIPQGQRQLGEKVLQFRHLLNSHTSDIQQLQATSKELYDLLIKPLEKELKTNKIQNLVFALDKVTRYIPMSALYDGKNYVVENYNISTVLSADLTDTKERLSIGVSKNPVLALGLSNSVAGWNPLPNVPAELDTIVQQDSTDEKGIFPGLKFLNEAFTREALRDNVNGHTILHIATHGKFEPNNLYGSFLLLGDGKPFTIDDIRNLPNLGDVHLVVLSACETALADAMQDGVEINSISYYFLNKGAKVVMASLWLVNDESTRLLMENFYNNLAKATAEKPVTKAEALRKAQLALITGNYAGADAERGIAVVAREGVPAGSPAKVKNRLSHPYYWAPFILIGNGL